MPDHQIWERDREQVSIRMDVSGAGFVIDVGSTPETWADIQKELENNPYARTENTHTSNQITAPTIRKREGNVSRAQVQQAVEDALTRLKFSKT